MFNLDPISKGTKRHAQNKWLKLFGDKIAAYFEDRKKHINSPTFSSKILNI
jgi:hypothetical protein